MHGERVRWCEPWKKWLLWSGQRWVVDAQREIDAMAKQTSDSMWADIGTVLPGMEAGECGQFLRFATKTANADGIGNMWR